MQAVQSQIFGQVLGPKAECPAFIRAHLNGRR
jgi:hypothetical protein